MNEKQIEALERRHRDIAVHGAGALALQAEREALAERREAWVKKHNLACFRCKTRIGGWAAGGVNQWGRKWVLCDRCVREKRGAGS